MTYCKKHFSGDRYRTPTTEKKNRQQKRPSEKKNDHDILTKVQNLEMVTEGVCVAPVAGRPHQIRVPE